MNTKTIYLEILMWDKEDFTCCERKNIKQGYIYIPINILKNSCLRRDDLSLDLNNRVDKSAVWMTTITSTTFGYDLILYYTKKGI